MSRRPGRLALVGGLALSLGVAAIAWAWAGPTGRCRARSDPLLALRAGRRLTVPAGVPVTIVLRNDDPIDHEWIVGDAASTSGTGPARSRVTRRGRPR